MKLIFSIKLLQMKSQNLAMLEAKHAAESDGFIKRKIKFLQWQKIWM